MTLAGGGARLGRIVSWNPMNTTSLGRLPRILDYCAKSLAVCIHGTRHKAGQHRISESRVGNFHVFQSGYGGTCNSHAGVTVAVNAKRFERKHVVSLVFPSDQSLHGRALVVPVKRGATDIALCSVYIPPMKASKAQIAASKLYSWLSACMSRLPCRCTPVICLGANGKVGLSEVTGDCEVVGPKMPDKEDSNGRLLREFSESFSLALCNT